MRRLADLEEQAGGRRLPGRQADFNQRALNSGARTGMFSEPCRHGEPKKREREEKTSTERTKGEKKRKEKKGGQTEEGRRTKKRIDTATPNRM